MKYFLVVNVVLWILCIWAYRSVGHTDDFGTALVSLIVGAAAAIGSVVYVGMALWLHRFL